MPKTREWWLENTVYTNKFGDRMREYLVGIGKPAGYSYQELCDAEHFAYYTLA